MNKQIQPGYKQTQIGIIPEDWEVSIIGDVAKIGSGKDYKHLELGEFPVYGTGGYMRSVNDYLYDGESVCIGRKGTINSPMYLNCKFWTVDTLFYTYSFKNITPKYLYLLFLQIDWLKYNEASGVPSLSKSTIESIHISIPPLKEQEKISEILFIWDEAIARQQQLIEQKNILKKSMMQLTFSQKICFKDDSGNNYPEWEIKKLGDIAVFYKGKGISKVDIVDNGRFECIRYGELYTYYSEVIEIIKSRTNITAEELFFSESNDVIIPASGETQLEIATASCVLKKDVALGGDLNIIRTKLNGVFLAYYLNTQKKKEIMAIVQGVSVVHLYPSQLKTLELNLPELPEQTKIANFLSSIDYEIVKQTKILKQLKLQKKSLMQKLLTGQVRVI